MHYNHLTREQRYAIYLGLQEGKSLKAIARQIKVHASTVSREIKRNSTRLGRYSWRIAQESADIRKERTPGNRGIDNNVLQEALHLLKTEDWSPKQISGYLSMKSEYISHETIYKRIRSDESGELRSHCRHKLKYRRHVKAARKTKVRNIPGRTSIHDRPAEADGKRFGDWEMDLIIGKGQKSAILTLCERSKNYLLMAKSQKHSALLYILQTRMHPGKKVPLRMKTNLSGNTYPRERILRNYPKTSLRRFNIKLTEDQGKNSTFPLQKGSSSN